MKYSGSHTVPLVYTPRALGAFSRVEASFTYSSPRWRGGCSLSTTATITWAWWDLAAARACSFSIKLLLAQYSASPSGTGASIKDTATVMPSMSNTAVVPSSFEAASSPFSGGYSMSQSSFSWRLKASRSHSGVDRSTKPAKGPASLCRSASSRAWSIQYWRMASTMASHFSWAVSGS